MGKKQVLPVGQGEFHTLPGAFQQGLWDPRLGSAGLLTCNLRQTTVPLPASVSLSAKGGGNSPCSGPKGFLLFPMLP